MSLKSRKIITVTKYMPSTPSMLCISNIKPAEPKNNPQSNFRNPASYFYCPGKNKICTSTHDKFRVCFTVPRLP